MERKTILKSVTLLTVVSLILLMCVPLSSHAAGERVRKITGRVSSLDLASSTIIVVSPRKKAPKMLTFRVTPETSLLLGREGRLLKDLKVGEEVTVQYVKEGKRLIARSVLVHSPKSQ